MTIVHTTDGIEIVRPSIYLFTVLNWSLH